MKSLSIALLLVFVLASRCFATAIVVAPLPEADVLLTSPTVKVVAHGVQTILTYRVTLEIENQSTSDTLAIAVDKESLHVYTDEQGEYALNREPIDEGGIWLRYDTSGGKLFYLRRMKPAYIREAGSDQVETLVHLHYTDRLVVPPLTTMGIDLDFDLPTGEPPQRLTLVLDKVSLGHGIEVDAVESYEVAGRGVLRYLRGAFAPLLSRERQERMN